jgi:hypothetical protein
VSGDSFSALARSSPWRWRTLRFTYAWRGALLVLGEPVRAWVRRPDALRVETLDGELISAGHEQRSSAVLLTSAGRGQPVENPAPLEPRAPAPEFGVDGLVIRRPSVGVDYDDPMFQSYHWVAALDPVELADGNQPGRRPVVVEQPHTVDHYGRPAWEAVLRPTDDYYPRCSCCPLLHSAHSDRLEWDETDGSAPVREPGFTYADAFRVRLDTATGVCVRTEQLGGSQAGTGHEVVIEAVDEDMPEAVFIDARRRRAPRGWQRARPGRIS